MKTRKSNILSLISLIKLIAIATFIIFDIWVLISIFNVGFNNCSPEAIKNIWSWNFFVVFCK